MATFKVGQRVRVLPSRAEPWTAEGVIVGYDDCPPLGKSDGLPCPWIVRADNHPSPSPTSGPFAHCWWTYEAYMVPLTDPKADAFLERIKNLKPYEEPKAPQTVAVRIGDREDVIDLDELMRRTLRTSGELFAWK